MAASWSASSSTVDVSNGAFSAYATKTTHTLTVDLSAFNSGTFYFSEYWTPDYQSAYGLPVINLASNRAITGSTFEKSHNDTYPSRSVRLATSPFYQLASASGTGGFVTPNYDFAIDGSGDVYCKITSMEIFVNGAWPIIESGEPSASNSSFCVAIPAGMQSYFSDFFIVPPTHLLLSGSYTSPYNTASFLGFARYNETLHTSARYITCSDSAKIVGDATYNRILSYFADGDIGISNYINSPDRLYDISVGATLMASDIVYYPGTPPTSWDVVATYYDKTGSSLGTQNLSSSYSALDANTYVAEFMDGLSIPSGSVSVAFSGLDRPLASARLIAHPGYSPVPCQEADGGWIPGVSWKIT